MITDLLKPRHATSPHMLALSAGIHVVSLTLLIVGAQYLSVPHKLPESGVTRVRLVESPALPGGVPEQSPQQTQEILKPEPATFSKEISPNSSPENDQLKTVFAKADPAEPAIQMKKRKQKPEKIEPKKKQTESKTKPEKARNDLEKKSDPNEFLEKRLAAIKKNIETKKTEKSGRIDDKRLETPAGAGSRVSANGSKGDIEIYQWFEAVRNKINSNWSVFGDEKLAPKVTIISLQLSDQGDLIKATIDMSSGDRFFDGSAMRAIHQAAPFPPVTAEVSAKIRDAGGLALRFTPGGLQ